MNTTETDHQKAFARFQKELENSAVEIPAESTAEAVATGDAERLSLAVNRLQTELALALRLFNKIVFSSSLGIEDQVLTDFIFKNNLPINIFTLDTGRLFKETYDVLAETTAKYGKPILSYYPETERIEAYVNTHGINAFKNSISLRKTCCAIRKLEPLKRALSGAELWLTGIRSSQSAERQTQTVLSWDETHHIIKFNPLLHWSDAEISAYAKTYKIPYNPLHDTGFVSIGCAPCTRAIRAGEDFRAGRWWWETGSDRECGLHLTPSEQPTSKQT